MANVGQQQAQRTVSLILSIIKGMALYPQNHPALLRPLQELHQLVTSLTASQEELHLGVMDHILFVDRVLFVNPASSEDELAGILMGKEMEAASIHKDVSVKELAAFLALMAQNEQTAQSIQQQLTRSAIKNIRIRTLETKKAATKVPPKQHRAFGTYKKALDAVKSTFREIESGRIPSGKEIGKIVDELVDMTAKDPSAMAGLAMIKDYDNYTFNHCVNVGILAMALGVALKMDHQRLRNLGLAGLLHDIGKVTVRKSILNKPGKLSSAEYEEIKKHAENGARIISKMKEIGEDVALAVLGHHIMHNRQGYPEWARNRSFDESAGIIALADCYDAVTTMRVYQRPVSPKEAIERLRELSGSYLNTELVEHFAAMMGKYPVGTLVRLDTNEVGVVTKPNPAAADAPTVKIIFDSAGSRINEPREVKTSEASTRIVGIVDPGARNVDVAAYLT